MILTKYLFHLSVRLTEQFVTVGSVTLRFYCNYVGYLIAINKIINTISLNFLFPNLPPSKLMFDVFIIFFHYVLGFGGEHPAYACYEESHFEKLEEEN